MSKTAPQTPAKEAQETQTPVTQTPETQEVANNPDFVTEETVFEDDDDGEITADADQAQRVKELDPDGVTVVRVLVDCQIRNISLHPNDLIELRGADVAALLDQGVIDDSQAGVEFCLSINARIYGL